MAKPTDLPQATWASSLEHCRGYFRSRGWSPHPFQESLWRAYGAGLGGLLHVPTGSGKTFAAYFGPLADIHASGGPGLQLLYITPLRAVTRDIEVALRAPVEALGWDIDIESRTGDTNKALKARQGRRMPKILITTPESLSLLIARKNSRRIFKGLKGIIVDEWHELLGNKRGTQVELALARLRRFAPGLWTVALSATIGNLEEAAQCAVGEGSPAQVFHSDIHRPVIVESVPPPKVEAFPWAGHMGLRMLPEVVGILDFSRSTLVFTNTRAQAELWYQGIRLGCPEHEDVIALHHGSLEKEERERVEAGLKDGALKVVISTSSLDLGVDFAPVERVVQIGSPKGVGRLLQRAGRSGHRPGATCHITCVPTHALQLMEIAAARDAIMAGEIEGRKPLLKPMDVLAQHLVTVALGGGFEADDLFEEVRTATSYRTLSREEFEWALSLVRDGGETLKAYPQHHRVVEEKGRYGVPDRRIARLHRLNIGTITSNATITLRFRRGRTLGHVEENFLGRLKRGERFIFAGRVLEFVQLKDMVAYVKPARGRTRFTPRWAGGRVPLSTSLSKALRRSLDDARRGTLSAPEMVVAKPILEAQGRLSRIPGDGQVLVELCKTKDGRHLFIYPFEGRLVHEGLGALIALRLSRIYPTTFGVTANDYGFELLTPAGIDIEPALTPALFDLDGLGEDILESLNLSELAKRQFRDIARVAGLVPQRYPGSGKSARQLQSSASLIYEVFKRYDPDNLLLHQAKREVLEAQLEEHRLAKTLARLQAGPLEILTIDQPSPLAFPLLVERLSSRLSAEKLGDRLARMTASWGAK